MVIKMRKRTRIITILFVMLISINMSFSVDLDTMKEKLDKINKNIQARKKDVIEVRKLQETEQEKLARIERELDKTQKEYNIVEEKFNTLVKKVKYSENAIATATEEIKGKKHEVRSELLLWYKYGEKSKLEYVFEGLNFFDFLDRYENIRTILKKNKTDIINISAVKEKIEKQKKILESQKEEMAIAKNELTEKGLQLEAKKVERNKLIAALKKKEGTYKKELSSLAMEKQKVEKEIQKIIAERVKKSSKKMDYSELKKQIGDMIYPIDGKLVQAYEEDKVIDFGTKIKSKGIELKGKMGDRVKAATDGKIVFNGSIDSLGKVIIMDNGNGVATVYGNLLTGYSPIGKDVKKGEIMGVLGLSQREKEPILYFEVRLNSQTIDPMMFLK